jgi:hypothetical protein
MLKAQNVGGEIVVNSIIEPDFEAQEEEDGLIVSFLKKVE